MTHRKQQKIMNGYITLEAGWHRRSASKVITPFIIFAVFDVSFRRYKLQKNYSFLHLFGSMTALAFLLMLKWSYNSNSIVNDASTFNNENFSSSTIQQCSSIQTRWTSHSIHQLNFTSVSDHAQSVLLSVVGQLKELWLCFFIHHQPNTNSLARSRSERKHLSWSSV